MEILFGRQPVYELLRAQRRAVARLVIHETDKESDTVAAILAMAAQRRIPVRTVSRDELERLCQGRHHQGMAAETAPYPYEDEKTLVAALEARPRDAFAVLLDHVQDPQNLGSLLRTAEAAGVHGVFIPKDRAVEVTPAAVRAAAGATEHLRIARVTNLTRTMAALQSAGLWMHGLEALPEARPYTACDLAGPVGIVIGSEGAGLGRLVRERCDFLMRLPLLGKTTSLNAGAAGAIALYEVLRQRSATPAPAANA